MSSKKTSNTNEENFLVGAHETVTSVTKDTASFGSQKFQTFKDCFSYLSDLIEEGFIETQKEDIKSLPDRLQFFVKQIEETKKLPKKEESLSGNKKEFQAKLKECKSEIEKLINLKEETKNCLEIGLQHQKIDMEIKNLEELKIHLENQISKIKEKESRYSMKFVSGVVNPKRKTPEEENPPEKEKFVVEYSSLKLAKKTE